MVCDENRIYDILFRLIFSPRLLFHIEPMSNLHAVFLSKIAYRRHKNTFSPRVSIEILFRIFSQ